jgi:3'-5' exoribonuclease 1
VTEAQRPASGRPWKPTCLYYTQGKCTMVIFLHNSKFLLSLSLHYFH